MNKPWNIVRDIKKILKRPVLSGEEICNEVLKAFEDDDPMGMWISGDEEDGRELLDRLGFDWDLIKEIFEEELYEFARLHAYEYEQDKKDDDLP
jgi:hypothetical protein